MRSASVSMMLYVIEHVCLCSSLRVQGLSSISASCDCALLFTVQWLLQSYARHGRDHERCQLVLLFTLSETKGHMKYITQVIDTHTHTHASLPYHMYKEGRQGENMLSL